MAANPKTLVCFGDSNTHGTKPMAHFGERGRYAADVRWTGYLRGALPKNVMLIEEGHPGRTTVHDDPIEGAHKNGLSALQVALETHRPVDLLLIMLGTNDFKARYSVTAADVARSIDRLLRIVKVSECGPNSGVPKVLLIAPPPIEERGCLAGIFEGGSTKSRGFAPLLADVAKEHGAGFVDAGKVIQISQVDGVHFEEDAHAALGKVISEDVARML
ncbi:SGNH/GDSL hydrolase family protein [Rhizobiales bacterium]|uniref:SGNH/GDSL hydrolase family protein n=1 Tax=Hongsoonwoonella zoysiae TaxID=2821844 RepID=UPI0015608696|nr:SGNH/GDSL hydrolase family protein [Hongsoonwoonella zoysiae]NRG18300.1 SGNH/GDSL hydrolase family protein [Hongsoonwoonella zoysiae]